MSRIIIQIYEIQDPNEAELLVKLDLDHIGSVIVDKRDWKSDEIKDVVCICKDSGKKSSLIFLFNDIDLILRAIDYYKPDILHLCDDITIDTENHVQRQMILKEKIPEIRIMRTIPIPPKNISVSFSLEEYLLKFSLCTDIFLVDTYIKDAPVAGYIGITGKTCNWELAREITINSLKPVILGGGLTPYNVYDALVFVGPHGVDSCTGTNAVDNEGKPVRFKKDLNKIKKFIKECRRYEKEKAISESASQFYQRNNRG